MVPKLFDRLYEQAYLAERHKEPLVRRLWEELELRSVSQCSRMADWFIDRQQEFDDTLDAMATRGRWRRRVEPKVGMIAIPPEVGHSMDAIMQYVLSQIQKQVFGS